jgi:peptidoglycan hydrolase-like protein with peptidoglycan-binding domain
MDVFRARVATFLNGTAPAPVLIPAAEPAAAAGQPAPRPTLVRNSHGVLVRDVQRKLVVPEDGTFGAITEAKLRAFQISKGLVPDGIVGPRTWAALDTV